MMNVARSLTAAQPMLDEPAIEAKQTESATIPTSDPVSPVASHKQHFENIFKKEAPTLTSPSEFKHYQPCSLVKKRHSWLKEEVINPSVNTRKPQQFKSPLLRRLVQQRSQTPTFDSDEQVKNSEYDREGRDEQEKENLKGKPVQESRTSPADITTENPLVSTVNSHASPKKIIPSPSVDQLLIQEIIGDPTLSQFNNVSDTLSAEAEEFKVVAPPYPHEVTESIDRKLNDSIRAEASEAEPATAHFCKSQQQEVALRRQLNHEKLKAAQRRYRKLKRLEKANETEMAVEEIGSNFFADETELHKQTLSTVVMTSSSSDREDWQIVRVNSQACNASCLDNMACIIL